MVSQLSTAVAVCLVVISLVNGQVVANSDEPPGDSEIAYITLDGDVVVGRLDGGEPRLLVRGPLSSLIWSHVGWHLAFITEIRHGRLEVVDANGGGRRTVAEPLSIWGPCPKGYSDDPQCINERWQEWDRLLDVGWWPDNSALVVATQGRIPTPLRTAARRPDLG